MTFTLDSRAVRPGMGFVALKGEKADGHDFIPHALAAGAAKIIDGLDELQREALAYRRKLSAKVIAITGSAGKTTTKELLKAFLSQVGKTYATEGNFNNHIGLPLTILNCPLDADFLVVEMGTNHPGEIAALCRIAEPDAGLITNVGTAHLEFFHDQDGIAAEKGVLAECAREFFVIGSDNVKLDSLKKRCRGEAVVAVVEVPWLREALQGILPGAHNVANAAIAYATASRFGVSPSAARAALTGFSLPGSRWRRFSRAGISFIDDSYNANPDSMLAAVNALAQERCAGRRIAVLGDMFELGEHSAELHRRAFDRARELKLPVVIGVGEFSAKCGGDYSYPDAATFWRELPKIAREGDLVLIKASHGMHLGEVPKD